MADVQFKRGALANLASTQIVDGTIYVTTDEHAMYVDNGAQRIRLGDFIPVNTIQDLPAAGHAYETAVYYVKEGNILARWDASNTKWIQINKAGVVGLTNQGSGSVVSSIALSTDDVGQLTLTVTKTNVASSADLAALTTRVGTAESNISTLQGQMTTLNADENTSGSIAYQLKAATDALINTETTYTDLKTIGDAIRTLQTGQSNLSTSLQTTTTTANNAASAAATNAAAIATLNGDASTEGSVAAAVAAEATLRSNEDTRLAGLISDNATDISGLTTRVTTLEGLPTRVTTLEGQVTTLNGDASTQGSVAYAVNAAIADVIDSAPDAFDTLKEIADWISSHNTDAANLTTTVSSHTTQIGNLSTAITTGDQALQAQIDTLNGDSTVTGSVDKKIADAMGTSLTDISNLQTTVGNLSTTVGTQGTNISALQTAVNTLNGDATTAGSVAKAVADEAALRSAADSALDTRLTTAEGDIDSLESSVAGLGTRMGTAETNITTIQGQLTWQAF